MQAAGHHGDCGYETGNRKIVPELCGPAPGKRHGGEQAEQQDGI